MDQVQFPKYTNNFTVKISAVNNVKIKFQFICDNNVAHTFYYTKLVCNKHIKILLVIMQDSTA